MTADLPDMEEPPQDALVQAFGRALAHAHRLREETALRAQHEKWHRDRTARMCVLTTDDLKSLWDRMYGPDDDGSFMVDRWCGDDVHAELNARGEGLYCAV